MSAVPLNAISSSVGPSPVPAPVIAPAQTTAKNHLQSIFGFLEPRPERARCYRVCRAWFSACKTDYSSNITDYILTSTRVFTWNTVQIYLSSINSNPLSPRKAEIPLFYGDPEQYSQKIASLIQKAARSIIHLKLDFSCTTSALASKYNHALSILFSLEGVNFPHVERLSFNHPRSLPRPPFLNTLLTHFPALREITLGQTPITEVATIIRSAPHLELETLYLDFDLTEVGNFENPEFKEAFRRLSEIHIVVDSRTISDEGLVNLSRSCSDLKIRSICISTLLESSVTDEGIFALRLLNKLQKVTLRLLPDITDSSFEMLSDLPELETLEIFSCAKITEGGVSTLARAPKLLSLRIDRIKFNLGFPSFSAFPTLQTLILTHFVGVCNFEEIGKCHLLQTLEISPFYPLNTERTVLLKDNEIAYIKRMLPNLKSLR